MFTAPFPYNLIGNKMLLPLRDYLPPTLRNNAYRKMNYLRDRHKRILYG
ncbi:hypothetical protein [Bacillus thuringiensis]|nr:hypothetical protein [Bacillus thuringiensis]